VVDEPAVLTVLALTVKEIIAHSQGNCGTLDRSQFLQRFDLVFLDKEVFALLPTTCMKVS
jgi:hypothetical protein